MSSLLATGRSLLRSSLSRPQTATGQRWSSSFAQMEVSPEKEAQKQQHLSVIQDMEKAYDAVIEVSPISLLGPVAMAEESLRQRLRLPKRKESFVITIEKKNAQPGENPLHRTFFWVSKSLGPIEGKYHVISTSTAENMQNRGLGRMGRFGTAFVAWKYGSGSKTLGTYTAQGMEKLCYFPNTEKCLKQIGEKWERAKSEVKPISGPVQPLAPMGRILLLATS